MPDTCEPSSYEALGGSGVLIVFLSTQQANISKHFSQWSLGLRSH